MTDGIQASLENMSYMFFTACFHTGIPYAHKEQSGKIKIQYPRPDPVKLFVTEHDCQDFNFYESVMEA
jgi:hypothetical protein